VLQLDVKTASLRSEFTIGTTDPSMMSADDILNELTCISFAAVTQREPTISDSIRMEALRVVIKYTELVEHH